MEILVIIYFLKSTESGKDREEFITDSFDTDRSLRYRSGNDDFVEFDSKEGRVIVPRNNIASIVMKELAENVTFITT